ncbi:CaiB/BaiF CoA transferase family protein [Sphingopyxis flava]|uniref:Crotonobetainyl-CoA:carnitine CoA-transferase CaiB n=1 Tax=Sphingopyxis flava TaxID=1507287 RepID=A0A1T5FM79_9SPHN|nr:CoA transferase [Sphingopyxis flava]SKB97198.1 Crotonobetainyl-CoA:carnitine CoA-transferase CaiB [Sphingopyxis flava]
MTEQIFSGLRVIEFGAGMATEMAGMLLADNGAEVIKVEPPEGAWTREKPAFLMWNRGKKSVVLDLAIDANREAAAAMIRSADIVIEGFRPGEARSLGLDYQSQATANPGLVHCSISSFGLISGFEYLDQSEAVVIAKSGRCNGNDLLSGAHFENRPTYICAPINECGAAFLAVQGICAALIAREKTQLGQEVTTSLIDGTSAATMRLAYERDGDKIVSVQHRGGGASLLIRCIRNTFLTAECADGRFIQMCARMPRHFRNWMEALDLMYIYQDERFRGAPLQLESFEAADALEDLIRARMLTRTMAEWMDLFTTQYDVGADPFLHPEEFLDHPQMIENGRIVSISDPQHGIVKQLGPLVLFDRTPSVIGQSAPALGEHQEVIGEMHDKPRPTAPDHDAAQRPPLEGITILELAYFLAAPLAATTLAEMGARVIKIEPPTGDPFRSSGLEFVHIVRGKESIALDLKQPASAEVFRRLVARADAILHNFRPGAPERLGVDYATVRAINPQIVYHYGASYGSNGPERMRPAFHSTPNALNGGGILQGGKDNVPIDDSYPDPISGLGAGVALAMGLLARARFGIGQSQETTMLTSGGYIYSERLTLVEDAEPLPMLDHEQLGLSAFQRYYQTRDGWLLLNVIRPGEWERLADAVGHPEWVDDERFATPAARKANDEILTRFLEGIFKAGDASHWEKSLASAGVPAAEAAGLFEEFLARHGMLEEGEHPAYGSYWMLKPRVRFSRGGNRSGVPSARGEHTAALLREVGFDDREIERMAHDGVVFLAEAA